jgi:preprotein translocase subunit SecA
LDLDCAPGDRALAERIWEKWSGDEDVYAKLARRQQWMMTLGAELSRRWRDRRKPVVQEKKPAPNQGCPCGSGKKYKRCCGR